jgi:hypothetical protein
MAAPVPQTRVLPTAVRLDDGYQSVIVFDGYESLAIYEKSVQPPAMDGGDPIDTTTMLNTTVETKKPQCLVGFDDGTVVAAYDPGELDTLYALVNEEISITYAYPDGSAYCHWGSVRRVEPSPLVKGEQPEVTLTIVVTNWDPVNCVEAGPVFVDGTGSCANC